VLSKPLRIVRIGCLAALVAFVVLAVVVHLPVVQRSLLDRVVEDVERSTGLRFEVADVKVRVWPGRAIVSGLRTRDAQERWEVRADRMEIRWSWRHVVGTPHRLKSVAVEGLQVEAPGPFATMDDRPPSESETELFGVLQIDSLSLREGAAWAAVPDLEVAVAELRLDGRLGEHRAGVRIEAGAVQLERQARRLSFGSTDLEIAATPEGLLIERLRLAGTEVAVEATATLGPPTSPADSVDIVLNAELDVAKVVEFWDPVLAKRVPLGGWLEVSGWVRRRRPDGSLELELKHGGGPLNVSGLPVDELELSGAVDDLKIVAAAEAWGSVEARTDGASVRVAGRFEEARLAQLGAHIPRSLVGEVGRLSITGEMDLEAGMPFAISDASGRADLRLDGPDLRIEVSGGGPVGNVELERIRVIAPGMDVTGSGRIRDRQDVDFEMTAQVADPEDALAALNRWWPVSVESPVGGGSLEVAARLTGELRDPHFECDATWRKPRVAGRTLDVVTTHVEGILGGLVWRIAGEVDGVGVRAQGTADAYGRQGEGAYEFVVDSLDTAARWVDPLLEVAGRMAGEGTFRVGPSNLEVVNHSQIEDLVVAGLMVDAAEIDGKLADGGLTVERLDATIAGGSVRGWCRVDGMGPEAEIEGEVEIDDLDPSRLILSGGWIPLGGVVAGVKLGGSVGRPVASATIDWSAEGDESSPVEAIRLAASLAEGRVEVASGLIMIPGSELSLRATMPLGDLERPSWLWRDAPGGPVRFTLEGERVSSAPIAQALGREPLPIQASADLRLEGAWNLSNPLARVAELRLEGLTLDSDLESLRADRPVIVGVDGHTITVRAFRLVGGRSDLGLGGTINLESRQITAAGAGRFDADLVNSLGLPITVREPLELSLHLEGPVTAPIGGLAVRHPGGSLVMRDPPLEIAELTLDVASDGSLAEISDGSARVNGGTVDIGGGWDPVSGQGIVFEFEDVTLLLPMGVLTRWDGVVAVEPTSEPDMLATVVGDLQLDGGVWDRRVDVVGLMVGESEVGDEQPMLQGLALDLEIEGRSGVHVDNNLGRFDVGWSLLSVGGTAAHPAILGELKLQPGGVLLVSGQELPIHRGLIRFDGEAGSEPQIEFEHGGGGAGGGNLDVTALAGQGLLDSVSRVVGFTNSTLEPATIAVETETDPGRQFSVSRDLGRVVTLFLTTDISDVQDRSTLMQLSGISGVPGLALQAFSEAEGEDGLAVIERVTWGGTARDDDRPRIRKVRFEGEWPLGKRRLRKAGGLDHRQPWDPFLLFAGGVRLERELASEGYYAARVVGRVEGSEEAPTVIFECQAGPRQGVLFRGDRVPRAVRRTVVARYRPPPLEETAFDDMRATIERSLAARGYPEAQVTINRQQDRVEIAVSKGRDLELLGPEVVGVPPEVGERVARQLGSPEQLAGVVKEPQRFVRYLERVLEGEGYPEAVVGEVELVLDDRKTGRVVINVEPGTPAVVGALRVEGSDPLGAVDGAVHEIHPGTVFRRALVEQAVRQVRRQYREAGFTEADVRWRVERKEGHDRVVEIQIEPMMRAEVSAIEVTGLRHVRESTVVEAIGLEPGDTVAPSVIDAGAADLAAFAPIERVTVQTRPAGPGSAVVEADIIEKPRWMAGAGLRWTSERGAQALIDLRDGNLFGRGFGLALRGRWEREEQQWLVFSSLPPRPGGRISATASMGWYEGPSRISPDALREEEKGATLEASFTPNATTRLRTYLSFRNNRVFEVDPDPFFPIDVTTVISTLGWQAISNRLDDPFDPRRGTFGSVDIGWSSPELGSDVDTLSVTATGTLVTTPRRDWTWTQTVRLGLAHALSGELDPAVRLYAGGETSVRGFERNTIGPQIELGSQVFVIGGGSLFVLNEELRIPVNDWLRVAVFVDVGQVWETWGEAGFPLAIGAGLGLRFATPLGPLWADLAWPVTETVGKGGVKFYFGIGRPF